MTAAELTGAHDHDLIVRATLHDGPADLLLALPPGDDLRSRIAALLTATRAGLPDDVPLTSLELQMGGGGRGAHGGDR